MKTLGAAALCMLSGVSYFAAFWSFELFPLAWVALVPVLYAVRGRTLAQAFGCGWLFGTVTNLGGFYWVVHVIVEFGRLPLAFALVALVALCIYQGLLLALVVTLVRLADRDLGIRAVWSLPAAFVALEWLYPLLFPSYLGNSQFELVTLTQVVEITGPLGLTALVCFANGALFELVEARADRRAVRHARLWTPVGAFALCLAYGSARLAAVDRATAAADTLEVAIVQTNVGGRDKESDLSAFLADHVALSRSALAADPSIELVVWPEAVYDRAVLKDEDGTIRGAIRLGLERPVILGLTTVERADGSGLDYFNSVALVTPGGEVAGSSDKVHLLAFGETLPFSGLSPIIDGWLPQEGWFTAGTRARYLEHAGTSFLPMICYEDIIPAFTRRNWNAASPPDVLVNVTNDSWYGDTHEPMIHLALASLRSIETRRAMIRATNTGISAVIDPAGRVTARTGQWTREVLVADVPLIESGAPTVYLRLGDALGWLGAALVVVGLAATRGARRRRG